MRSSDDAPGAATLDVIDGHYQGWDFWIKVGNRMQQSIPRIMAQKVRTESLEAALDILRTANKSIGFGITLKEGEKAALYLLGRIQAYLYNRLERGEEIFESEKRMAGDGVQRVLIYLGKNGKI